MEYMLLSDGSVKAFECLSLHEDVIDALHDFGGAAHYWHNDSLGWSCITLETNYMANAQV